ncbi:MAG: ABC transporter substrate-binding protein [Armatimonadota bacterium]|nr:ABC transporter substrate-binding protein [Armatimonadota bacterium]
MKRSGHRWSAVLVVVAVLAVSTGLAGAQPRVPNPDTLLYGVYWEPVNLDPHAITDWGSMWMLDNTYETLVRYKTTEVKGKVVGTAEVQPHLAESYEVSPDGKTYTFRLRRGVKFHSGDEMTAEAVRYSINRMLTIGLGPSRLVAEYMDTTSTQAPDRYTVRIQLKKAAPFFLQLLAATNTGAIVNPRTVEAQGGIQAGKHNEWMARNVDGTGPFKWGPWKAGESFELVANPEYWQGTPKLRRIVFRIIRDMSTQLLLLLRGELDIVYRLPPDMTQQLIGNPDIIINRENGIGMHQVWMNNRMKPFDNKKVRQAVLYTIDPYAVNRAAAFGYATVAKSAIPTALEAWTDQYWPYRIDPGRAKSLLTEAGYPDGFKTEIYYNAGNTEREQTAIAVQAQLKKVGIEAEIRSIPWPTFVTNFQEGKMPLFALSGLSLPIVEDYVLSNFHSKNHGPKGNYAFYTNRDVDRLINQLLVTMDSKKRAAIIHAIQRLVIEDAPSAWIYNSMLFYAQRKWVKGWVLYPSGNWYFFPVQKAL